LCCLVSDNLVVPGILPDSQNSTPYNVPKGVWNRPVQKNIEQIVRRPAIHSFHQQCESGTINH